MSPGSRESQWQVMRRCLAIVCRVQRGPCDWRELVRSVRAQEGPEAYAGAEGDVLHRRVENDLRRVRDNLMVEVHFDRKLGGYVIKDTWRGLLDLPDEDLATMAWLEQTFDYDSPQHDEVQALLGRLRSYLPWDRRGKLERQRTMLAVDLNQKDDDTIPAEIWEKLSRALTHSQRIEFDYLSPTYEDGKPRRHVVDPWECTFNAGYGHHYLYSWCHYTDGPNGRQECNDYRTYRLGRMSDLHILPHKLPPSPPPARRYEVIYQLAPEVARGGITQHSHIEIETVEEQPDGSAIVHGSTDSLFWVILELLHYRYNCRVLGGPELRRDMRDTVRKMSEIYGENE